VTDRTLIYSGVAAIIVIFGGTMLAHYTLTPRHNGENAVLHPGEGSISRN
jgi:hypothetical protein